MQNKTVTTPVALLAELEDAYARAACDAKESHAEDKNSYGAGYDAGYSAALRDVIKRARGETDDI